MKKNYILAAIYTTTTMAKKQQRFLAVLLVFISLIFHYSNAMAQNGPVPVAFQKVIVGTACKGVTTVGSQVAVATGSGLRFSNDSGTTFTTYTTADGLTSDSVSCVSSYHPYGATYAGTNNGINAVYYESSFIYSFPSNFGLGSNNIQGIYADGSYILAATKNGLGISSNSGYFTNKTIWDGLGSNSVNGAFFLQTFNYINNLVYAATDGGLSIANRSGDGYFDNKTTSNGLGSNKVNGVIVSNGTIYAATDGGLSISTDDGTSFTNKTTVQGLASNIVNSVFVAGNTVYAATNGGLSISTDGGSIFTTFITNTPIYGVVASTSKVYVAALDGLYRSCDPSYSTETEDACGSYTWNGQTYTSSGTYTWSGTNAGGCDSVVTLNLTIKQPTTSTTTVSNCVSYTWNGTTYTASGTYTWTGTNAAGCDSTATLNLTINQSTTSTTTVSNCDSYTWNGTTYTASGTYTWTGTNAAGCDSVATLNLTIKQPTTSTTTVSNCVSYTWNGITYTTSGVKTWTGTNAAGCDSVATLNLTIKQPTTSTQSATACNSYIWNGTSYTTSGTKTWTGTNAAGCDSVATLNLTINVGTFNAETRVETSGYTWNGTLYAVSGTYTYSYNNSNGCASVDTLYLVVNTRIALNIGNVCTYIGTNEMLTYTASVAGASSYTWTLPANTQLVSGQGTRSIVIKLLNGFAAQANKQIRVTPAGGSLEVIYLSAQAPVTPTTIVASSTNICQSLGTNVPITFTIPRVYEQASNGRTTTSYIWTAQNGTTTISHPNGTGENDTTVSITFTSNFTSSNVNVRALNACGVSGTRSYFISRNNPSQSSLISGPTNTCEYIGINGQVATYSVSASASVDSYTWSVPQGAIGLTGQGTNTISFKYPAGYTGGSISVTATNNCGTSQSRSLALSRLTPSTPGNIDIVNTQVCPNREYTYSIANLPANATSMLWTVPASGTIVSGQGTRTITVSYPGSVVDGYVTTKSVSNCGVSTMRSLIIKLAPCPAAPTPQYTKGVSSTMPSAMEVTVFPNPTTSLFNVKVTTSLVENTKARLLDVQGRLIKTISINPNETITLGSDLKSGVYMLEVLQGEVRKVVRVVKY